MRYTIRRSKAAAYAEQLQLHIGELCNGSTYDSDSYCLGSNPSSPAICLHGQAVKTLPSQGKIMGSIPIGGATKQSVFVLFFLLLRISVRRAQKISGSSNALSVSPKPLRFPFFANRTKIIGLPFSRKCVRRQAVLTPAERTEPYFFTFFHWRIFPCSSCNPYKSLFCVFFYYMAYIIRRL